ncbi:HipA family kinase [Fervidibacillus albus]|uniref:HipA domain-containing protein n=1 Tax=Fervidibacillus albus TaxID=2980026 RepID=A0A9E8RV85_9BACI|nr:HipA family kinase [Fervidibacillus albus]WAA08643.1 HipA domain-containing protein [Fervidibacillus albus]
MEPIRYKGKLEGKSNAHFITFNDGFDYIVKFSQIGFEKSLANEWISYCLARYMGLPIPYAKIVEIPDDFSASFLSPEQINLSKYQFASRYVPDCVNGHECPTPIHCENKETVPSMIVFDYWLFNRDRTRKNVLFQRKHGNVYRLWTIDHAEVFNSYRWTLDELNRLPKDELLESATHRFLARFIDTEDGFSKAIEIMQKMPTLLIEDILELIPEDWNVSKEEKKGIVRQLIHRRKKIVPNLIDRFIEETYGTNRHSKNVEIDR